VQRPTAIHPELRADRGYLQMSAKDHAAEDRDLVIRASEGDVEAFTKLVRDNSSLVYRVALRMLGNDDAQDASQEVWVRVWRNITSFRGESAFSTWLYRITVNTCLSIRQKEARREERELGDEVPYLPEPSGGDADPEAAALNAERREEIQDALQHVRAEHRAALILRHMEGLSYAEIAKVLDVPDGTAKGWVSRGRAAMLVVLAENDGLHRAGEAGE
jgi:RNA polymerase sigma-70 factor, ECF subfamily